MKFLRDWVLHNAGLKLLALGTAFLLWFLYTADPPADVGYQVPVFFRNLPEGLTLSGEEPVQARVVLRGRPALLRRLQPAELSLEVDLAGRPAGELLVSPNEDNLKGSLGAQLTRIVPSPIRVKLVPRQSPR